MASLRRASARECVGPASRSTRPSSRRSCRGARDEQLESPPCTPTICGSPPRACVATPAIAIFERDLVARCRRWSRGSGSRPSWSTSWCSGCASVCWSRPRRVPPRSGAMPAAARWRDGSRSSRCARRSRWPSARRGRSPTGSIAWSRPVTTGVRPHARPLRRGVPRRLPRGARRSLRARSRRAAQPSSSSA